ncbi:MAG: type II toxin-antitoxin system VapC family toxin [Verrucomicrobiia bacterium]
MTLVDSNVLIDLLSHDPVWDPWSSSALEEAARHGLLAINPIIYAEISAAYNTPREVDENLSLSTFSRLDLPWEAAFLAGKAFVTYRRRGGTRRSPLPDFYIGAHAQVKGLTLLTRDATRYRRYFPKLKIVAPN